MLRSEQLKRTASYKLRLEQLNFKFRLEQLNVKFRLEQLHLKFRLEQVNLKDPFGANLTEP